MRLNPPNLWKTPIAVHTFMHRTKSGKIFKCVWRLTSKLRVHDLMALRLDPKGKDETLEAMEWSEHVKTTTENL